MANTITARKAEIGKRRFRRALKAAGMTAGQWAAANGVSATHLSQTLSGRPSNRLWEKIEAFTEKYLKADAA